MKQWISLFVLVTMMLLLITPIATHAQEITPTPDEEVPAQEQEPGQPTYLPSIIDNPGPPPDAIKKEPQVAGIAPWGYVLNFTDKLEINKLLEGTSFQQNQTIKTPNNRTDGAQKERAAVFLSPHSLQEQCLKLITYQQHMTANHVQCYYDEDGGSRHTPDQNIFSPVTLGWHALRAGTKLLHALVSVGSLSCEALNFYENLPDEKVAVDNGLSCGTQMQGKHIGLYEGGDRKHIYNGSDNNRWSRDEFCPESAVEEFLACRERNRHLAPDEEPEPCELLCSGNAHTVYSTRMPDAERVNIEYGVGENGEREGFSLAFIPDRFKVFFEHGINTQGHTLQIPLCPGCGVTTETSVYYGEFGRRYTDRVRECLNQSEYQPVQYKTDKTCDLEVGASNTSGPSAETSNLTTPRAACTLADAGQPNGGSTSSPATIIAAADAAGIPNCVLDGVYAMESSRGANSSCTPNVCGAVGPFGITVGYTASNQNGQCSQDTACSQCPAGYCPNAISGTNYTAADMCDTGKAAAMAASLLKGKAGFFGKDLSGTNGDILNSVDLQTAIIAAGNSYFGSNHVFTTGSNIEPGCSYGESLLKKYCGVSSYTCDPKTNFNPNDPQGSADSL